MTILPLQELRFSLTTMLLLLLLVVVVVAPSPRRVLFSDCRVGQRYVTAFCMRASHDEAATAGWLLK